MQKKERWFIINICNEYFPGMCVFLYGGNEETGARVKIN